MKFLKYLFFLILIVAIGGAIYIATVDGDFQAEDSLVVDAPPQLLFNEVNELKNWEEWGLFVNDDENLVMSFPEKTNGVGASYSWKGDSAPDGSLETTDLIQNKSITQTITTESSFGPSESTMYWKFDNVENGTKVTWGVKGTQSFQNKAYWLLQDKSYMETLKPQFPKSLTTIQANVEEAMSEYNINVDGITQYSGGFYMYNSTSSTLSNVGDKMAEMMPQIMNYMQENNIPITGSQMTIYEQWDRANNNVIISSAIPTSSKVITPNESPVLCGFMPSRKVVKTTLKGDYKNLQEAWQTAENYIAENALEKLETAKDFEIYRTDPSTEPNPAKWVTEIYIPIK